MEEKLLRKIVIFLTLVLLFSSVYVSTNIAESTKASSQGINVLPGNIIFTGNVTKDFAGHLIATNTHATFWGSDNNISQLYVSFNVTYLFIGIKEIVDNNGLLVFLSNNTNSGYGTYNMANLNVWQRKINFTSPMNYLAGVWFSGLNTPSNYGGAVFVVNSPVNESNTSPHAIEIPGSSNYFVFNGTNDTTEIRIPWTALFPYGHSENLIMNISVFIVGGSGPWVGIGIPYYQEGQYNNGNQAEFTINNTIPLDFRFYSVQFKEIGLPLNTTWYVNITNVGSSGPITDILYSTVLPNGTYSYTVATANKIYEPKINATGSFVVNGKRVLINVTFIEVTYNITFTESGLPTETNWSVTLNGTIKSSNTSAIIFSEPNGTYTFSVESVSGYKASPSSGTITVNGSNVNQAITFSQVTYTVTFTESGLPSGTPWYVNLSNGQSFKSTGTKISFSEPNGTYSYTITTVNKNYAANPSSGTFTVNGAAVSESITFIELYTATFTESGLPSGIPWYVNLSNGQSFSSTKAIITFKEANGTYTYMVGTVNKIYEPKINATGSFVVNGKGVLINVTFIEVTYNITFTESGLPSGTSWSVTLNGTIKSSNTSAIIFSEPNGTYTFSVESVSGYKASPSSGTITVNGSNVNQAITFSQVTYTVTFTESGLPSGTPWYVNLSNGQSFKSTGTKISFSEPNGTYSYTITTVNKNYAPVPSSGTLKVSGANVQVSITFSLVTYTVTFTESGLPSGIPWYVNLSNGQSFSSTKAIITFKEANGTYTYMVGTVNKIYEPKINATGSFVVNGKGVLVNVTFIEVTYNITFTENGLPSGTSWSVTLNGTTKSTNSTTIMFQEPNGTYVFSVIPINGYSITPNTGTIVVNGENVNNQITFTVLTYSVTFTENGLSSGTTWTVMLNGKAFNGETINKTLSSSANTITFNVPNGTYSYTIPGISGYRASNYSGSVIISGHTINIEITWTVITYPIKITQTGIPNGTEWSVTLTGTTFNGQYINTTMNSTTNTITFYEPNGTYSYTIHLPSGYQGTNLTGSASVSGTTVTIPIKAQTTMNYMFFIVIVIVIVIVIIGAFVGIKIRKPKTKRPKEWKPEEKK